MVASGEDALPAPAAEALEGVRSRAERLEHVLERFVPLPADGGQPVLRHRHRMRLLGERVAGQGVRDEQRDALANASQTDGLLFDVNVVRIDGWTREDDGRWRPPDNPRAAVPLADIVPLKDPRAIAMDDAGLNGLIYALYLWLDKNLPSLNYTPTATEPLVTSVALARAGLYYLDTARAVAIRERDPEQRARRHARRLELIGRAFAPRGVTESDLEAVRPLSRIAEVLFTHYALRTDGWTGSPERGWMPPVEAVEPVPRNTG